MDFEGFSFDSADRKNDGARDYDREAWTSPLQSFGSLKSESLKTAK